MIRRVHGVAPEVSRLLEAVSLVAFDFDGVIANTEPLHAISYQRLLAESGVVFDPRDFAPYVGKQDREIYRLLGENYGVSLDVNTVGQRRRALFVKAAIDSGLRPYPYVVPLLKCLAAASYPAMILSLQSRPVVDRLLRHWDLRRFFRRILTVRDGIAGWGTKAELVSSLSCRVRLPPDRIVLFEDSAVVLRHARSVGLRTVGVVHALGDQAEMEADVLIRNPESR
jgi:beta-phosphoglucomutase